MPGFLRRAPLALLLLLAGGAAPSPPGAKPAAQPAPKGKADPHARVRGVTISCQTWGWEWGSPAMGPALDRVRALGGNWVAIHPYARIRRDGSLRWRQRSAPAWLVKPIQAAHRRGLKILIKPHLAYWGSGFSWRGAITFQDPAAWRRFFADYERWVSWLARECAGADAFCVGTELERTLGHEQAWRSVIRKVRGILPKQPLTYAANWDGYQRVPFWDALDVIGIQAYFPLVAAGKPATAQALTQAWTRRRGEIAAFAAKRGRRVVFTELGYDASLRAASQPWKSGQRGLSKAQLAQARALQERCMQVALQGLRKDPWVVGAFLWKAFAGPAPGEDFQLERAEMKRAIRGVWAPRGASGGR